MSLTNLLREGSGGGGGDDDAAAGLLLLQEMIENVTVLINCAATVNFNERLKISLATNVTSVRHLLAFARRLNHLEAFVHVSTAYSQCDRLYIEEKFYPPVVDPVSLIEAVESMSDETITAITKGLIGRRPNTYTLTKSLGEEIIRREAVGLPVVIVRPSIVGAVAESPLPGWTDTLNGPGGLYVALADALMRVMPGDGDAICDIVPVDFCANVIISMAWKVGIQQPEHPVIFNCHSGTVNPISWTEHDKIIVWASRTRPITKFMYPFGPDFTHVKSRLKYRVQELYYHTIPSYIIDTFKVITFQRPSLRRLYARLNSSMTAYSFFTSHNWKWENTSYTTLLAEMKEEDRKEFNFDFSTYQWKSYIANYWEGCKSLVAAMEKKKVSKSTMAEVATPSVDGPTATTAVTVPTKLISFLSWSNVTSTILISSVICGAAYATVTFSSSGHLVFSRPHFGALSTMMPSLSLRKD
jgi:fatty acyl-CoA reductase